MEVLYPRCAGLDVHSRCVNACARIAAGRKVTTEHREFTTTTAGLLELAAWLIRGGLHARGLEAPACTGSRCGTSSKTKLRHAGARQRAAHPERSGAQERPEGRGLDRRPVGARADPEQLRAAGPDPGAARPDADPQATGPCARHTLRLQKTLEDANVKLTRVASDILGVSGRAILAALIAGETDPERLADCTKGRLKADRRTSSPRCTAG